MYPPLWTSLLVATHDDIENRSVLSIEISTNRADPLPIAIQKNLQESLPDQGKLSFLITLTHIKHVSSQFFSDLFTHHEEDVAYSWSFVGTTRHLHIVPQW